MASEETSTYLVGKRFPNRLFVGGLPPPVSATELAEFFSNFAAVIDSKVICDDAGISKGYGFVSFKSTKDVKRVCQMGTLFLRNKKLNIGPAVKKEGPTIQPEVVIVPSAPSKGEFYYPTLPQVQQVQYEPQLYYYSLPMEPTQYNNNNNNNSNYLNTFPSHGCYGNYLPMEAPCNVINYSEVPCANAYEPPMNEESRKGGYFKKQPRRQNLPPRLKTKRSH